VGPTNLAAGNKGTVTITVTPVADGNGDAPLTIAITDKNTTGSTNVLLQVKEVNDAPTISSIANYTGDKGVQAGGAIKDIVFQVADVETDAKSLTVTAKARKKGTDTLSTSIPDANLFISQSGTNRVLAITTIGTDPEMVTVTVSVSDGNRTSTSSFDVEVKLAQPVPGSVFANTGSITIKDNASADASTITVAGLRGKVYGLSVTLDGFSHAAPDDVDVLLKGPNGKAIKIMSDAGGRIAASNLRLEFSDTGANGLLRDDGPLTSGVYIPSDYEGGTDSFPGSGITSFEKTFKDAFAGVDPNGNWTLYVVDDTASDAGSIAQGWSIKIVTTPTIVFNTGGGGVNYLDYSEDTTKATSVILADYDLPTGTADGYDLQKRSSNESVVRADKVLATKLVNFDKNASETAIPVTMVPEDNAYDESTNLVVTLTFVRKSDNASASLVVTNVIRAVNDRPTLTRTTDRSTTEGQPIEFTLLIQDPPEPSDNNPIHLVATTIERDDIISSTNILLNGISNKIDTVVGKEVVVRLVPNAVSVTSSQRAKIRIVATDSSLTSPAKQDSLPTLGFGEFYFTVNPKNDAPSIDTVADQNVTAGKVLSFNIVVKDPDDTTDIKVTGVARDTTLIDGAVTVSPEKAGTGSRTVTAKAALAVTGSTFIDLTVEDPKGAKATQSVKVTVSPSRERRYEGKVIKINDLAVGDPYPSVIGIDDLVGNVSKVRVELTGFTHGYPDDADLVLVSPKGTKVMLMSDAGGSTSVTNINLVFNNPTAGDPSADPISDLGPLVSGTFRPANWDIANDPFAGGPSAPFETDLGKFVGEAAKGEWKLYAVDDTRQDAGEIKSWALYITTAPRIEGLPASLAINEDDTFQVPFTIVDESFASLKIGFGFSSTNAAVVSPADLSASQIKNENFVLNGKPVLNASGAAEITIFATNEFNQVVTGKLPITVAAVNDPPFVTKVNDVVIFSGEATTPVAFDYGDAENNKKDLVLEITSSNPELIPTSNVLQIGNTLVIAPVGTLTGESEITIRVTDKSGLQDKTTFKVTVLKALQAQFANTAAITLRDNNSAQAYPSTVDVSGLKGKVSKVTLTLAQVTHPYPADLDVLLVSPTGTNKVVLLSDAGGGRKLDNTRLTFDDGDTNTPAVPYNPSAAVTNGTYKPSNYEGTGDAFASPAPSGPYTYELKSFQGIDPNGTWSLYIMDDVTPDSGTISGGWVLNIFTTEPVISTIADQATDETVPLTVAFQVSDADTALDKLVATATTDRPSLLSVGPVVGTGKDRTVTLTPVGFENGSAAVTIELSDGTSTVSQTFNVTVRSVNQAPVITGLSDKSTPSNRTLTVPFVVADNETASSNIVVGATIERPSFGSVEVADGGANRILTFRPSGEQGNTRVTVVASDGELTSTNSIEITIGSPYTLTISPIADQNVTENGSKIVPFVVSGSDSGNVSVSVSIVDNTIVEKVELVGSGSAWSATVFAKPGANGSTVVNLVATDEFGSGTGSFNVNIIPLDDPPVISPIADVTTYVNINAIVRTTVSDPDTAITDLTFTWGSSNPSLVKTVLFSVNPPNTVVATIIPNRDQIGEASVTLFAADATTKVGRPLLFKVIPVPNEPPMLGKITDTTTSVNERLIVEIPVTDPDTAISDLVFTATVSNPTVLRPIGFSNDGTTVKALINPVTDASGLSAVTITVFDGKSTVSTSFAVAVAPAEPPTLETPVLTRNADGSVTISITWSNGGELEYATSAQGPWTKTGNSSGSFSEPATGGSKFYRVNRNN
jgi:subtilisin-like proprotein convertase family protein